MSKIVRYEIDLDNPPPLTAEERAQLDLLSAREINTDDIRELSDEEWTNAPRKSYFKPVKQQLTLRLDSDLIAWFKRRAPNGRGYQSDINSALREYVSGKQRKAG